MSNEVLNPDSQFLDATGNPLGAGTLTFYVNLASTTLSTIYSDEALTAAQSNPFTLDASGRTSANIKFIGKKRMVVKDVSGSTIRTIDNVTTAGNDDIGAVTVVATFAALASTAATVEQIVMIAGHTTAGDGGGNFIGTAGSVTNDGGTKINSATVGIYWQRINYVELTLYDFGVLKNSASDQKTLIQNAITKAASYGVKLVIKKDTYYFQLSADDQYAVTIPNNSNIVAEQGSSFELLSYAAYDSYQLVAIYDVDNIYIENLLVNGRKDLRAANVSFTASITGTVMTVTAVASGTFVNLMSIFDAAAGVTVGTYITSFGTGVGGTGTYNVSISQTVTSRALTASSGEFGMGYSIRGSTNVILNNCAANKCWGDSFYLGQSTTSGLAYNKNITLYKPEGDGSRRQGLSLVSGKIVHIYDAYFKNIGYKAPAAGIDFEPNSNTCFLEDIRVYNLTTDTCWGYGIQVDISLLAGATAKHVDIKVFNHKDYGSNAAITCSNADTTSGTYIIDGLIEFIDCVSHNALNNAFVAGHWDYRAARIDYIRPTTIDPNRNGQTSSVFGSPFCVFRNSAGLTQTIGNVRFIEPTCILNSGTIPKVYLCNDTLSNGNELLNAFIDPVKIPQDYSNTMYSGVVSNKYRQGLRISGGSETIGGNNAGLGFLTYTGAAATYTLSHSLFFADGPDIYIEIGGDTYGATVKPQAGGRFLNQAVDKTYILSGIYHKGSYLRIKPLGIQEQSAFTASIAAGVMTVTASVGLTIAVGQTVVYSGSPSPLTITSLGTGVGGNGTYNLSSAVTAGSQAMTTTAGLFNIIENIGGWA